MIQYAQSIMTITMISVHGGDLAINADLAIEHSITGDIGKALLGNHRRTTGMVNGSLLP